MIPFTMLQNCAKKQRFFGDYYNKPTQCFKTLIINQLILFLIIVTLCVKLILSTNSENNGYNVS